MGQTLRALVLDRGGESAAPQLDSLLGRVTDMSVRRSGHLDLLAEYDVYMVDVVGDSADATVSMMRLLRERNTPALLIAYGDIPEAKYVKALAHAGCDGFLFGEDDVDHVQTLLQACQEMTLARRQGFGGIVRSLSHLLSQWNRRLELMEQS